jgi:hypothetical protein
VVSVRQPVLHYVLTYNWVLALVSLLAYSSIRWPRPIEWTYYPLYLGIGWLLKSFLQQRIPDAVAELHQSGALPDAVYPRLSQELDRALNHRAGVTACGLIGATLIIWFFWPGPPCSWSRLACWLWWIAAAVDVVYGYAVGAATWKAVALARHVRAWGRGRHLTIRPFHPGGGGGLAAIGRLFLSLSRILAVGGLFCAVWLILAMVKSMTGTVAVRLTEGVEYFLPGLAGGLIVIIAIGIVAFVAPMMTVHRLMAQKAREARAERDALAVAIAELEGSLLSRGADPQPRARGAAAPAIARAPRCLRPGSAHSDLARRARTVSTARGQLGRTPPGGGDVRRAVDGLGGEAGRQDAGLAAVDEAARAVGWSTGSIGSRTSSSTSSRPSASRSSRS